MTNISVTQVKRIHEYKRQLMNILHVILLYNRYRTGSDILFAIAAQVENLAMFLQDQEESHGFFRTQNCHDGRQGGELNFVIIIQNKIFFPLRTLRGWYP